MEAHALTEQDIANQVRHHAEHPGKLARIRQGVAEYAEHLRQGYAAQYTPDNRAAAKARSAKAAKRQMSMATYVAGHQKDLDALRAVDDLAAKADPDAYAYALLAAAHDRVFAHAFNAADPLAPKPIIDADAIFPRVLRDDPAAGMARLSLLALIRNGSTAGPSMAIGMKAARAAEARVMTLEAALKHRVQDLAIAEHGDLTFGDDGALRVIGTPSHGKYLRTLLDNLRMFFSSVAFCERDNAGSYLLRHSTAGYVGGIRSQWDKVSLLASAVLSRLHTPLTKDQLEAIKTQPVSVVHATFDRKHLTEAEALWRLHFLLPDGDGSTWATHISSTKVEELKAIQHAIIDHYAIHDAEEAAKYRELVPRDSAIPLAKPATAADSRKPEFAHADDFTWIIWKGETHTFTKGNQAQVIRVLWEQWERGGRNEGCGLGQETIGEKVGSADSAFRLDHVFRKHATWKLIIKPVGKGTFALSTAITD